MAKTAIISGAHLSHVSRGDDPPYPPVSAGADKNSVVAYATWVRREAAVS
jgi:hypothetical protein